MRKYFFILVGLLLAVTTLTARAVNWAVDTKGTANYAAFKATSPVQSGSTLRIRVGKKGASAQIKLKKADQTVQEWNPNQGDVLTYTLSEAFRPAIVIGGANFYHKAQSASSASDYTVLNFEGGWILHAKVVGPSF